MSRVANPAPRQQPPIGLELYLQINVGVLVILGTSLLAMGQQNVIYALVAAVAAASAIFATDVKGYFRLGPDATTVAAIFACVVLVIQVIRNVEQSQLLNVANILIYLEIILLFQQKQDRTYWSLMALSLLQVVVAAALNLGLIFGLLLAVYVLTAGTAMMLFFAVREVRPYLPSQSDPESDRLHEPSGDVTSFIGTLSPDAGASIINRALLRRLGRMIAITAVATVIIFFAIPRYSSTAWQGTKQEQIATVGFTEEVRLDDIGRILESPEQVMRVEFTDLQGRPYKIDGEPYFRGTVLWDYKGSGLWKQVPFGHAIRPLSTQRSSDLASTVLQRITLQPGSHSVLFNVAPCYYVDGSPGNLDLNLYTRQLMLSDEENERRGTFRYTLGTTAFRNGWQRDLVPAVFRTRSIAMLDTTDEWIQDRLRRDNPSLVQIANSTIAQLSLEQASAFERSKALENHFRRSGIYTYSLDVNQNRNRRLDPIEDFVSNHHTGHCEYFAGALTLMLRSQGIPARMVVGYKGGEFNAVGNYYIVRQLHAHAWVEAFLTNDEVPEDERDMPEELVNGCWLRLDPTPDVIDGTSEGELFAVITTVREFIDYCQVLWDDYVLGLNSTRQQQAIYQPIARSLRMLATALFGAEAWQQRRAWCERSWSWLIAHRTFGVPTLLPLSLAGLIFTGVMYRSRHQLWRAVLRVIQRWPRQGTPLNSRRPQLEAYRRLEATLGHLGLIRAPAQTPFEFVGVAEAHLAQFGSHSSALSAPRRITDAYCRFRYGQQPLSADEQRQLLDDVRQLETAIQAGKLSPREQQTP